MKLGKALIRTAIICALLIAAWEVAFVPEKESLENRPDEAASVAGKVSVSAQEIPKSTPDEKQGVHTDSSQNEYPGWVNNDGRFTSSTEQLLAWVESGQPLDIQIEGLPIQRLAFREIRLTSDNFKISTGTDRVMPSEYRIYSGRHMGADGPAEGASLAIVNGAFSITTSRDGTDYLVETDKDTGELYAIALHAFDNPHSCTSSCREPHGVCSLIDDGRIAVVRAAEGVGINDPERIPVSALYPDDVTELDSGLAPAEAPTFDASTAGKPYLRNGPEYDASLKDILVMMVSSKNQTGDSSGLSAKAASMFAITARAAEIYERQLGLRYMLQELILIPSDSSEDDPGTESATLGDDLYHLQGWVTAHRPQSTYKWGHVALWTEVAGAPSGTIGLAWTKAYGNASYGHSTQELNWGWSVHIHELGHNVGAEHTSGGVMNPNLITSTENFFTTSQSGSYTGAMDIYSYMGNKSSYSYVFGPASLRHPEEMPFGVDDATSTPADQVVSLDVLSNDLASVPFGATNSLRLVEVGQVYPKAAGSASVVDGMVEFTPANGFTGQAWFAYTLGGDIGNNGSGWLHRADVVVTVGGDSTFPGSSPALSLSNDFISSELTSGVRLNPLLNDEGSGHLWSGDVEAVVSPADSTPESYSYRSLHLVNATVLTGTGTLSLETHNMTRSSNGGNPEYTGYMTYTPGDNESGEVVIEYTVEDSTGNQTTAYAYLADLPSVGVNANYLTTAEDSGDVIVFTINRPASADTSVDEIVSFSVSGTAVPSGLAADYALAGQQSFDPISGTGTVVIPSGALSQTMLMAIEDDGVSEGQETMILTITGCSSLLVSGASSTTTIWINDSSLIYSESFDTFTSNSATWDNWTNLQNANRNGKGGEDIYDWVIATGSTPTSGTGPSADHTSGSGNYFLAEATGHSNEYTIIQSKTIDTSGVGAADMEFFYHMQGSSMGSLVVDLYADGVLVAANLFSASGEQSSSGSDWNHASFNLDAYLPAQTLFFRFRADMGSGELSDIAIDDISINAQSSSLPQSPAILADPTGCTVDFGQGVYLSVIPQGFPVPQVQWYKDGAAIPGAIGAAYYINSMDEAYAGNYEAAVANSQGAIMSQAARVSLPPSANPNYNAWVQLFADTAGWTSDELEADSDPDYDGVANSLEYAFGMNPTAASRSGLPAVQKAADPQGDKFLEITFKRRKNDPGVIYSVETSHTLSTDGWITGTGVVQEISAVDDGTGEYEMVTVRRVSPLGNGPGFMRINIELVDPGA